MELDRRAVNWNYLYMAIVAIDICHFYFLQKIRKTKTKTGINHFDFDRTTASNSVTI